MCAALENWDPDVEQAVPDVGRLADCFERAAMLSRRDPLRRGNVIHLPPRGDAIVLGDLHGDVENFRRVVRWAALPRHRDRYLVLQELVHACPAEGEADESFRLLEEAARLKCRFGSQVHILLSNHDLAELTGDEIIKQGRTCREPFLRGVRGAYGEAWERVHEAYCRLLKALPLAAQTANGVFMCHSTPDHEAMQRFDFEVFTEPVDFSSLRPNSSIHALVWGRDYRDCCGERFAEAVGARVLVTGHRTSMPGVKAATPRHIALSSDGSLGSFLVVPLSGKVLPGPLARQAMKIRSLKLPGEGEGR